MAPAAPEPLKRALELAMRGAYVWPMAEKAIARGNMRALAIAVAVAPKSHVAMLRAEGDRVAGCMEAKLDDAVKVLENFCSNSARVVDGEDDLLAQAVAVRELVRARAHMLRSCDILRPEIFHFLPRQSWRWLHTLVLTLTRSGFVCLNGFLYRKILIFIPFSSVVLTHAQTAAIETAHTRTVSDEDETISKKKRRRKRGSFLL